MQAQLLYTGSPPQPHLPHTEQEKNKKSRLCRTLGAAPQGCPLPKWCSKESLFYQTQRHQHAKLIPNSAPGLGIHVHASDTGGVPQVPSLQLIPRVVPTTPGLWQQGETGTDGTAGQPRQTSELPCDAYSWCSGYNPPTDVYTECGCTPRPQQPQRAVGTSPCFLESSPISEPCEN